MALAPSRVALVTGAGRGVGRAVAVGLARQGIPVGLIGRTRSALERVAAECAGAGSDAVPAVADVTDPAAVATAVDLVEDQLGGVDLLVSNAGLVDPAEVPFGEADLEDVWRVVEVNLRGPMVLLRTLLPRLASRGGGRVVHVNSGFAYRAAHAYTGYAISKGALARLTAAVAAQHGTTVRIFDISPGLVRTDMTAGMPIFADVPHGGWTPPERMVEFVLAVAQGRLDPLSGRFLHAGKDDIDALLARAAGIVAAGARVLRLVTYGPEDPLTG